MLNVALQLVPYKIPSVAANKGSENTTNASSCSYRLTLREERLRTQVSTRDICSGEALTQIPSKAVRRCFAI